MSDRQALLNLLGSLEPAEWTASTACAGWDVRDVALHILGGDLANIAGRRDGAWGLQPLAGERLGAFINRINQEWVTSARRLSPRLINELLQFAGPLLFEHLESLNLHSLGGPVSWAGPEPAPVWLDVAREYMERWVHQQHIRDAVASPGQTEAQFVVPVIAASMHAVPIAMSGAAVARAEVRPVDALAQCSCDRIAIREANRPGRRLCRPGIRPRNRSRSCRQASSWWATRCCSTVLLIGESTL